jgi:hypothetical protein
MKRKAHNIACLVIGIVVAAWLCREAMVLKAISKHLAGQELSSWESNRIAAVQARVSDE